MDSPVRCERFTPDEWDPEVCAYCALPPEKHRRRGGARTREERDALRARIDTLAARTVALCARLDEIGDKLAGLFR